MSKFADPTARPYLPECQAHFDDPENKCTRCGPLPAGGILGELNPFSPPSDHLCVVVELVRDRPDTFLEFLKMKAI